MSAQHQTQPPEVFILVKPPPSKNTHPLNVQIQLVAGLSTSTNGAGATRITSRASGEFSRSESGASTPGGSFDAVASASVSGGGGAGGSGMVRSSSIRSSSVRSGRSGSSSLGSQAGQNSRRVTPLYNLQFHAVLATVVTDAGTDAKIAKFLKKGVEVHHLAILDPVELFPPSSSPAASSPPSLPSSSNKSLPPLETASRSAPPPTQATTSTPTESSFLSKLGFKRLSLNKSSGGGGGGGGTTSLLPPSLSTSSLSSKLSAAVSGSKGTSADSSLTSLPHSTSTSSGLATLNVVPLFRTPSNSEIASSLGAGKSSESVHSATAAGPSRATSKQGCGYVWVVRKWLRNDLEGNGKGAQVPTSDIRFEWKRAPRKAAAAHHGRRQSVVLLSPSLSGPGSTAGATSDTHLPRSATSALRGEDKITSRRSLDQTRPSMSRKLSPAHPLLAGEEQTLDPNNLGLRANARPKSVSGARTPDSERSRSPGPTAGGWDPDYFEDEGDSGEESDPEDSERPWTCELLHGISSSPKTPPKRLLLATLTPSPHHPKLVAHLAVPFSLSPIPLGAYDPATGVSNEGLSVEEMKDVVMVTALWLVVRESLGGGGKRRKEKGWRGVKGR